MQSFLRLQSCYMWTLPFIYRRLNHQSFVNMDRSRRIQRWILPIATLLTSLVGMVVALSPDGLALMEFKDGLNVTSPLLQNWSRSDASPCSWGGINCTESGDVRSILLSKQDPVLEGNITSSLGKLKSLEVLMLDENSLSGSIPPELGNLTSLAKLVLGHNSLLGGIPPELGNLRSLVTLSLAMNRLAGEIPPHLGNCSSLIELWLDSNMLSGNIPESLGNLKNLSSVFLSWNLLTGAILVPYAALSELNIFVVAGNKFTGDMTTALEALSKLPAIKILHFYNNSFNGTLPPSIGNATSLTNLELLLQSGGGFGGQIPKELGKLVNLISLGLEDNNFTGEIPPDLGNMTSLQILSLSNNSITGPIPVNLTSLTALEEIYLHYNNMSGPIPEDFGRFMSNLTTFSISYNSFNGSLPEGLCNGGKLKWLLVNSNRLRGDIPSSLASCATLFRVRLSDNQFTTIPQGFGSNSSLVFLDVSRNQLTGQLPTNLGTNSQLGHLDFSENRLTGNISVLEFSQLAQNLSVLNLAENKFVGEIPAVMAMCKLLFRVDLSYNSLTGSVPPALANLSSLQMLHLQGNNLTALHPSIYSGLATNLRSLNLAENPWNAPIATEIGSLKILRTLNLSHGGHTGSIPSVLGQLTQLEVLDLSHNNLTGEVASSLGDLMTSLTSLTSVNISFNRLTGSLPPEWVKFLVADPDSFRGNPGLCLHYNANNICMSRTPAGSGGKIKLSVGVIVGIVMGIALALLIFVALLFGWRMPAKTGLKPAPVHIIVKNLTKDPLPFTFEEIMAATENLSDAYIIGRGGHGVVYKVALASRAPIVVKKIVSLDMTTAVVHKSFWREVDTIVHAKHRNLVRLVGFIKWGEVGLILYGYVSNGDLYSALHNRKGGCHVDLTWKARLRIAEGVAHGLAYLHHDYNPPIIHRNIKSRNYFWTMLWKCTSLILVMLSCWICKRDLKSGYQFPTSLELMATLFRVGPIRNTFTSFDFHNVLGEVGYGTMVSPHLEVYSYGVLLLELLTGKEPINPSYGESLHIVAWVMAIVLQNEGRMSESKLHPLLLADLTNLVAKEEILFVQNIALMCTRKNPTDWPTMTEVANMLQRVSETTKKKYNKGNVNGNREKNKNNNGHEEGNGDIDRNKNKNVNEKVEVKENKFYH